MNLKSTLLLLLLLNASNIFSMNSEVESERPIFLWDIHGVLLQRDLKGLFSGLWNYPHKLSLLTSVGLMYKIAQLIWRNLGDEVISTDYLDLAEQNGYPEFKKLVEVWGTSYTPIPDTVEFVKELKKCGYRHHVGSNIDRRLFDAMLERYPEMKEFFTDNFELEYTQTTGRYVDGIIRKKPQFSYYRHYLKAVYDEEFKKVPPESRDDWFAKKASGILFVDDRPDNVNAAEKIGFNGFHYTSSKELRDNVLEYLKKIEQPIPVCVPSNG